MSKVQASLRTNKKTSRQWHNWLALLCVFVAVYLLIKAYYPAVSNQPQSDTATNSIQPSVQFDFYTVLPKMLVSTPVPSSEDSTASLPYVLQMASFRVRADAQRLCERIQTLGMHAFIQEYKSNQTLWYRVVMGPYPSPSLAEHDQQQLKSHHINSMLLRSQR